MLPLTRRRGAMDSKKRCGAVGAIGVGKIELAHLSAPHDEATMSRTRSRLAMHRRLRR